MVNETWQEISAVILAILSIPLGLWLPWKLGKVKEDRLAERARYGREKFGNVPSAAVPRPEGVV